MNVEDVATPVVLVMATQLVPLWLGVHPLVLPKVAEAPLAGAVNVTAALGTGLPLLSSTVTVSGLANAAEVLAVWLPPVGFANWDGFPAMMLNEFALVGAARAESVLLDAVSW